MIRAFWKTNVNLYKCYRSSRNKFIQELLAIHQEFKMILYTENTDTI